MAEKKTAFIFTGIGHAVACRLGLFQSILVPSFTSFSALPENSPFSVTKWALRYQNKESWASVQKIEIEFPIFLQKKIKLEVWFTFRTLCESLPKLLWYTSICQPGFWGTQPVLLYNSCKNYKLMLLTLGYFPLHSSPPPAIHLGSIPYELLSQKSLLHSLLTV